MENAKNAEFKRRFLVNAKVFVKKNTKIMVVYKELHFLSFSLEDH